MFNLSRPLSGIFVRLEAALPEDTTLFATTAGGAVLLVLPLVQGQGAMAPVTITVTDEGYVEVMSSDGPDTVALLETIITVMKNSGDDTFYERRDHVVTKDVSPNDI